ncbi:chemotaxis protein CheX [Leadbettera azotonutricia]|uniref:Chemotaxis protein CheX n=1 Tax=Leadbettera azotonutricia (strain ATCC BAA-888 / DSM 13862 / ZAS-9) TaxID=545695 RepID=F5YG12_LEAAZ|nr:chemotaxis protein CheX [Leadbettera azotonutricia]AEF81406.1 chemotaxis protein CheX [Leadbettera azotonutricia ZAS-9]
MRVEYINPFVEAAFNVLKEVLNTEVKRGDLFLKSSSMQIMGVAAMVGLAGDVEGRVLFDMNKETALFVVSAMNGEEFKTMDEMAKATIQELANMITAQAVTKLHDLGFKFDLTPPALFTGDNMEVATNMGKDVEALIVPMQLGVGGKSGKIEINVVIRERA